MALHLSSNQKKLIAFVIVVVAMWIPRGLDLKHFVTIDERTWLILAANFYEGISSGVYENTYQLSHPCVTNMWIGAMGFALGIPEFASQAPGQFDRRTTDFLDFVLATGHTPLQILGISRAIVAAITSLVLGVAFLYALRLLGWWPSIFGFGLILLDPFPTAFARFLHPDGLVMLFMFLSGLAYLSYLYAGRRTLDLIVSAIAAALAILTKTPGLFIAGLIFLMAILEQVVYLYTHKEQQRVGDALRSTVSRVVLPLLLWTVITVVFFVGLWPAMWVEPVQVLRNVAEAMRSFASQGHESAVFFDGRIVNGDPGTWFYPVTWLWRTTPVVMLGLALTVIAFIRNGPITRAAPVRYTALALLLWAVLFIVFMNLGSKKGGRYLLPIYLPLDLLAGIGWASFAYWLTRFFSGRITRYATPIAAALVVVAQAAFALPTYPYYITYYNPILGGAEKAWDVLAIGWGEGLDETGRWLNQMTDAGEIDEDALVASWYYLGSLSYFYDGDLTANAFSWMADYSVIYAHQWQRQLPTRRMMHHFNSLEPIETIDVDGIEYARIYNMNGADFADYTVDFNDEIRLVYYESTPGVLYPGLHWSMIVHAVKMKPIDAVYNFRVRLVSQDGEEVYRSDGWPRASVTNKWEVGTRARSKPYDYEIPKDMKPGLYQIEVGFIDNRTKEYLPVTSANTGEPLPSQYLLDYLVIGDPQHKPKNTFRPSYHIAEQLALTGADVLDGEGEPMKRGDATLKLGDTVTFRLFWDTIAYMYRDYDVFLEIVDQNNETVLLHQQAPLDGFIPTSYWPPRQEMIDEHAIRLPEELTPGPYTVRAGIVDPATMERLPITVSGEPAGDTADIATIVIE